MEFRYNRWLYKRPSIVTEKICLNALLYVWASQRQQVLAKQLHNMDILYSQLQSIPNKMSLLHFRVHMSVFQNGSSYMYI